jgi:hypothetical protein
MSDTNPILPAPPASPVDIFWRISWPFFLFTLVLLGIFALSWAYLLPRYTRVEINGTAMTGTEIKDHKTSLTAQVAALEAARRTLVLAVNDPAYDALKTHRKERKTLESVTTVFEEHAKTVQGGRVVFRSFAYDPGKNALTLRGDVRDAGVSSMTVLAQYAESLKTLPDVKSVTIPAFSRMEDPRIGTYSPFDITVTFQ